VYSTLAARGLAASPPCTAMRHLQQEGHSEMVLPASSEQHVASTTAVILSPNACKTMVNMIAARHNCLRWKHP
jgi:hypothetical protein